MVKRENIMIPKPRSNFLSVQCPKCGEKTVIFSHTTTIRNCKSCGEVLAENTGARAKILGKVVDTLD